MRTKLWVKLTAAFVFVALVGVVLVAYGANRATAVSFQRFLQADENSQLQSLQTNLATFYAAQASWDGVNQVLRDSGLGPETGGYFLRVTDETGQQVGVRGGQGRNQAEFDVSFPIIVAGKEVGRLWADPAGGGVGRAGEQFLLAVNQAIIWAGLVALVFALILGLFLAQRLTRPLRQLTHATQAVAAGDLSQQVAVTSQDELGELGEHFNQMAHALETAEAQRQQLLADTAHDLRTPISVIQSHLEAMLDGVFPPTPENLAVIHEETLHLGRLVNDVRTLSLVEAGQLPLDMQVVDLSAIVQQAAAAFAPLAEADGIRFTTDLVQTATVTADAARIHQVLANLIANALRYAPQGSQTPPIVHVKLTTHAASAEVHIQDSGPGLTAEQQEQVFGRFWRADSARVREQGGSGLGLAIAKGIVEAHGGDIDVVSQMGVGSTFVFSLPQIVIPY